MLLGGLYLGCVINYTLLLSSQPEKTSFLFSLTLLLFSFILNAFACLLLETIPIYNNIICINFSSLQMSSKHANAFRIKENNNRYTNNTTKKKMQLSDSIETSINFVTIYDTFDLFIITIFFCSFHTKK